MDNEKPYIADYLTTDEIRFVSGISSLHLLTKGVERIGMRFPIKNNPNSVVLHNKGLELTIHSWFPLKDIIFKQTNVLLLDESDNIFKEYEVSNNFTLKTSLKEHRHNIIPHFQYAFKLKLIRDTGWIDPHYLPNEDELIFTYFKRNAHITSLLDFPKNSIVQTEEDMLKTIELLKQIKDDYF